MSFDDKKYLFTNPEDFNSKTQFICEDAYAEYIKFKNFFSQGYQKFGHNAFPPTIAVFNSVKEFVGMITARDSEDKSDLYSAVAEMLYFPMSIKSELFIVANDVTFVSSENSSIRDALSISYVTPDNCLIFTVPYSCENDNLTFHEDSAYILKIASSTDDFNPIGDLVEMFFIFSRGRTNGPFSPEEILAYLSSVGFTHQIFHPERMSDNRTFVPFMD